MQITATNFQGDSWSCQAIHFMAPGDRVAFENQFNLSTSVMSKFKNLVDEDGKFIEGADLSDLREAWMAFFSWRELRRHHPQISRDWDTFIDNLADLKIVGEKKGEENEDPSAAAAPPT